MTELAVRELPLFPLPDVVLFPEEVLPLHIFESRYRIMLQSVLETDSRFGVVRLNPATKKIEDVGCCAQIVKYQTSEAGRSNIVTLGQQRFRVLEIIREAPFTSAMVSWIDDQQIENQNSYLDIAFIGKSIHYHRFLYTSSSDLIWKSRTSISF